MLPHKFEDKIADTFYDKDINIISKNQTLDAEGGVVINDNGVSSTFKGNVRFNNLKTIQEEYGLDYQIDVAITTRKSTLISLNDLIMYKNITYVVNDAIPFDSHILIVATKWK